LSIRTWPQSRHRHRRRMISPSAVPDQVGRARQADGRTARAGGALRGIRPVRGLHPGPPAELTEGDRGPVILRSPSIFRE
jgi:hypothetical protein